MFKGISLNLACALLATISNSLLKQSMQNRISSGGSALSTLLQLSGLLKLPVFWISIATFIAANVLWLYIVSQQPISVAFPLQISLVLVMTTIVSVTVFSEQISPSRITGMILIIAGIVLVSRQ